MNGIFPADILSQLGRDRGTLLALRCTCKEHAGLVSAVKWHIRVVGGKRNRWIEHLYCDKDRRLILLEYNSKLGQHACVHVDDVVVAKFSMRKWRNANDRLRSRYIFECSLVGIRPPVPIYIERIWTNLRAVNGEVTEFTTPDGVKCDIWDNYNITFITSSCSCSIPPGGNPAIFAIMQ